MGHFQEDKERPRTLLLCSPTSGSSYPIPFDVVHFFISTSFLIGVCKPVEHGLESAMLSADSKGEPGKR